MPNPDLSKRAVRPERRRRALPGRARAASARTRRARGTPSRWRTCSPPASRATWRPSPPSPLSRTASGPPRAPCPCAGQATDPACCHPCVRVGLPEQLVCPFSACASVAPTREAAARFGDARGRPRAAAAGAGAPASGMPCSCPPRRVRAAATSPNPDPYRRGLEKALDRMRAAWDGLAFRVLDWKDTGTHVLGGVDDVQARAWP